MTTVNVMRCLGLAGDGDVIQLALDGEQRDGGDVLRPRHLDAHFAMIRFVA
jgi:hypothetical protein